MLTTYTNFKQLRRFKRLFRRKVKRLKKRFKKLFYKQSNVLKNKKVKKFKKKKLSKNYYQSGAFLLYYYKKKKLLIKNRKKKNFIRRICSRLFSKRRIHNRLRKKVLKKKVVKLKYKPKVFKKFRGRAEVLKKFKKNSSLAKKRKKKKERLYKNLLFKKNYKQSKDLLKDLRSRVFHSKQILHRKHKFDSFNLFIKSKNFAYFKRNTKPCFDRKKLRFLKHFKQKLFKTKHSQFDKKEFV